MANYPQELVQDAVCQSHTGQMTGLWFLPTRPLRLNTNEWMILRTRLCRNTVSVGTRRRLLIILTHDVRIILISRINWVGWRLMGSTVHVFPHCSPEEGDGSSLRKSAFNDSSHQPIDTSSSDAVQQYEPKCKLIIPPYFRNECRDHAKSRDLKTVFVWSS